MNHKEIEVETLTEYGAYKLFDEFVEWAKKTLDSIPAEHRDSATIQFDSESDYDTHYVEVRVKYTRPETDAEMAERDANAAARRAEEVRHLEARLAQLRRS